jgi:hypothetical protein
MQKNPDIQKRFRGFRATKMLDLASSLLTVIKSSCQISIGVDQGLLIEAEIPSHYRSVRHPTLPLLFEYNCTRAAVHSSNFGKFVVASEAGFAEEALFGPCSLVLGAGIFNKYYEAQFVSSTKKRIYAFEEREKTADIG